MGKHPDVFIGTVTDYEGGSLEIMVSGVDVVLTLVREGVRERIALAPDENSLLTKLLERALLVE